MPLTKLPKIFLQIGRFLADISKVGATERCVQWMLLTILENKK
jgi:hypothetical protein